MSRRGSGTAENGGAGSSVIGTEVALSRAMSRATRPSTAPPSRLFGDRDPDQLISEFDARLLEINQLLGQMKGQATTHQQDTGRHEAGGPRGASVGFRDRSASAHSARGPRPATASPGGLSRSASMRRASEGPIKDGKPGPPRIPGAPRALIEKIQMYRESASARRELYMRAKAHKEAMSEEHPLDPHLTGINFILANRKSLSSRGAGQVILTTLEQQLQSPRAGSTSPPRNRTSDGEDQAAGESASEQAAAAGPASSPRQQGPPSFLTEVPERGSPPRERGGGGSARGSRPSTAHPSPSQQYHPPQQQQSQLHTPEKNLLTLTVARSPTASRSSAGSFARPTSAFTDPTGRSPSHSAVTAWASGRIQRPESAATTTTAATLAASPQAEHKALRTVLTARPASGGSPTKMEPFRSEQRYLAAVRNERAEEARQRRDELAADVQERKEVMAGRRQRQAEEEAARLEEEKQAEELGKRRARLLGVSALAHKLAFIIAKLKVDRAARPYRSLRKEAAVRIATWYKHILFRRLPLSRGNFPRLSGRLRKEAAVRIARWYKHILFRRRQKELFELIRGLQRAMKRHIPAVRQRMRVTCAMRIVEFMQDVERQQTNMATVAVRRFLYTIRRIQSWWRVMMSVRRTQSLVLYKHLAKFERDLVKDNRRKAQDAKAAHLAAAQMALRGGRKGQARQHGPTAPSSEAKLHASASRGSRGASHSLADTHSSRASSFAARRVIEIEDPVLEAALAAHKELLPKDIRAQMVEHALHAERRHFFKRMDKYRSELKIYEAQLPIENLRLKLMREAGLEAECRIKRPVQPHMFVMLPRSKLKALLYKGIQLAAARQEELADGLHA